MGTEVNGVCGKHEDEKEDFTHEGLSAHAHNIVEVHGWLLFVAVKKTILCCSFLTLVANKQQALWCKAKS